jgi:hypothetical protein
MNNIGEQIWAHEDVMLLAGLQLRLRMTIVKLQDGRLWLHSPTKLSPELKQSVDELGEVAFIVGAGNGHNIWLSTWEDAYPAAELYVSDGIPARVQLKNPKLISAANGDIWPADFLQATMPEVPMFDETVFLHHASKSLIVTDIIQHHDEHQPQKLSARIAKSMFGFFGFKGKCVAPPLKMGFVRKNKAAFSTFVEQIKSWDFEQIIVTYGDVIDKNAKQVFADLSQRFLVK